MRTGRGASMERRKVLSAGQTALMGPSAISTERRRSGSGESTPTGRRASVQRRLQLSAGKGNTVGLPPAPGAPEQNSAPSQEQAAPASAPTTIVPQGGTAHAGREASVARRRQLSAGKEAVPHADVTATAGVTLEGGSIATGRDASQIRRQQLSAGKSAFTGVPTDAQTAPSPRPNQAPDTEADSISASEDRGRTAVGRPDRVSFALAEPGYAPKVIESRTHLGQAMTGLRIGPSERMTGAEPGAVLPVTGNQYYGEESGPAVRGRPPKVGAAITPGGQTVSGTLVRSKIAITGDEHGDRQRITGRTDQAIGDDLTPRDESMGGTQFPRATDPHGHNAAASQFLAGRQGRPASTGRSQEPALEITMKGYSVSGTAVGRSERMTGNEPGSERRISGTQYAGSRRSSKAQAFEPPAEGRRRDPATGAKVVEALTFRGQRVTGPEFEHVERVTGSEAGAYVAATGTPYQGPASVASFLDQEAVNRVAERVVRGPSQKPVTGDRAVSDGGITGTQRGAERDITGTPYYRDEEDVATRGEDDPAVSAIAKIDHEFSIATPQRRSHLRAASTETSEGDAGRGITGSFTFGEGKVTGNSEFLHTPRTSPRDQRPAVTGEGVTARGRITGDSWRDQSNVTGTEGHIASNRNPTRRGGERHSFAGATKFKPGQAPFDPDHGVTGILINTEDATLTENTRVTVSGGALS